MKNRKNILKMALGGQFDDPNSPTDPDEGGDPNAKKPLGNTDYKNWNKVVDYAQSRGVNPNDLDHDSNVGYGIIDDYNKQNPNSPFDRNRVQDIQDLMLKVRQDSIDKMRSIPKEYAGDTYKQFGDDFSKFMPGLSKSDNFPGSKTLAWKVPKAYLSTNGAQKQMVGYTPNTDVTKFDTGGVVGGITKAAPDVLNALMSILNGTPNYSVQPIVNTSTMRNMATPYSGSMAMGGTVDDLDSDEYMNIQQMANEQGISVEEALQMYQKQYSQDSSSLGDEGNQYGEEDNNDNKDNFALGGDIGGPPSKLKPKYNFPSAYMFNHVQPQFDPQPSDSTNYSNMFNKALQDKTLNPTSFYNTANKFIGGYATDYDAVHGLNAARGAYLDNMISGNAISDAREQQGNAYKQDTGKFAYGGIHIKKSHEGKFTAYKAKTGKTTQQAMHSKNAHVRAMAVFANNAGKWKHAYGDTVNSGNPTVSNPPAMSNTPNNNVEVEGGEAVQTPDGSVSQVSGPKHEQGGVGVNLPDDSKVYSNRLKVDGKSMKARKLDRENRMNKIQKIMSRNYASQLVTNTAQRTMQNIQGEEDQDMALQKAASQIYSPPQLKNPTTNQVKDPTTNQVKKFDTGGTVGDGGDDGGYTNYANRVNGLTYPNTPYNVQAPFAADDMAKPAPISGMTPTMGTSTNYINPNTSLSPSIPTATTPKVGSNDSNYGFTTGDYIGMAGTAAGAIAPLVNTLNNRRGTLPNINRFQGYGHDALATNDAEQSYLNTDKGNDLSDIDTAANSSYSRNNNSSTSVNTSRALNIATDIDADKARTNTRANFARQMVGVLGQRGQLQNMKDYREMAGASQVDDENKGDRDNFYSNLGNNFSNLATGVQTMGRDFNIRQSNNDDSDLLGLLTKNGIKIGRGSDGQLKLMNTNG